VCSSPRPDSTWSYQEPFLSSGKRGTIREEDQPCSLAASAIAIAAAASALATGPAWADGREPYQRGRDSRLQQGRAAYDPGVLDSYPFGASPYQDTLADKVRCFGATT
jgi:hypothetical protein